MGRVVIVVIEVIEVMVVFLTSKTKWAFWDSTLWMIGRYPKDLNRG